MLTRHTVFLCIVTLSQSPVVYIPFNCKVYFVIQYRGDGLFLLDKGRVAVVTVQVTSGLVIVYIVSQPNLKYVHESPLWPWPARLNLEVQ